MIREKSATTDEENGQCIATVGDDVPRSSQDPSPQSYKAPDRVRVKTGEESEGQQPIPRCVHMQPTSGEATRRECQGVTIILEIDQRTCRTRQNIKGERAETRDEENSSRMVPDPTNHLDGGTAAQYDSITYEEGPRGDGNERIAEMNALHRIGGP